MILLNHWRDFQNQLIHTHTNFQLIPMSSLSGRSGILLVILYSSIITQCWIFRCIFMVLSGFLSNHKRFEVWYLTYLCINFQLLAMRGLPSELDNILVLLFVNNCKWLCDCLSYSNQIRHQDVLLHYLSVQISRQSGSTCVLYNNFNTSAKRKKN